MEAVSNSLLELVITTPSCPEGFAEQYCMLLSLLVPAKADDTASQALLPLAFGPGTWAFREGGFCDYEMDWDSGNLGSFPGFATDSLCNL